MATENEANFENIAGEYRFFWYKSLYKLFIYQDIQNSLAILSLQPIPNSAYHASPLSSVKDPYGCLMGKVVEQLYAVL